MSPLHGLRLNCLLAPLLAAAIGAVAVVAGALYHRDVLLTVARAEAGATLRGLAELGEAEVAPPLPAWLAAHPAWRGVARVTVQDDALSVLERAGEVPLGHEPGPDLLLGYQGVRSWNDGGRLAVVAPCLPRAGAASIVVGWCAAPAEPPWGPWLALAGSVLLLGGGLGVYLVARVYRPVEWMDRAAAAAAAGQGELAGGPDSPETASLHSSIATLIRQRSQVKPAGQADGTSAS